MKSSLFLMEQLIAIFIFAVCAAVCVRIFADSYVISGEAAGLNNALVIARSAAECYKAAAGDAEKTAQILGGGFSGGNVNAYYGKDRQPCGEKDAEYFLSITRQGSPSVSEALINSKVAVFNAGGDEILAFDVAVRRVSE